MNNLKQRWGISSNFQMVVIFIVFAINGTASSKLSSLLLNYFEIGKPNISWFFYLIINFIVLTLIYPFLLIFTGFIFGQFRFFFPISKKILKYIGLGFIFKS